MRSGIAIEHAEVVIVGRGALVGMPLAIMLAQKAPRANATVTLCHTGTRDLLIHTRRAEILVVAAGRPRTVTADMIMPGATVIDVAVNRQADGKLVGDVAFDEVSKVAGAITPVPGGVGPMTDRHAPGQHGHGGGTGGRLGAGMTLRSGSRLERLLHRGVFAVTAEVVPPRGGNPEAVRRQALGLLGYADAVNVTDNPTATAHMSPVAGAGLVTEVGLEAVMQLTTRDRNRLGLSSDLLGAWALGARCVLCLSGDPPSVGDHPDAKGVYDLDVMELIGLVDGMRREGRLLSGAALEEPPRYFIGVADTPLAPGADLDRLERKADAGADFVQTQIVFDTDALGEWAEAARSRGLFERVSVLAGVAAPKGPRVLRYMREHLPGVVVPDRLIEVLDRAGPDAEAEGVRMAVEVVGRLRSIAGVAGVHVMGLGRTEPVRRVVAEAGLSPRPAVP